MDEATITAEVAAIEARLTALAARLDADAVADQDAPELWRGLDRVVRLATAARTVVARRVDDSQVWRRDGFASAVEYLAARSGTSLVAARAELATSRALTSLPATTGALLTGSLSAQQGAVIAEAAQVNPAAEGTLVAAAGRDSFKELRERSLAAKAAGDPDPEGTQRRIHHHRSLRHFIDTEGAWNLRARGSVTDGETIAAALGQALDELFDEQRTVDATQRDTYEARSFDALVRVCHRAASVTDQPAAATPPVRRQRRRALIRVDLEALRRGHTEGDEVCELAGLGPIPVPRAVELLGDATVQLVITNGTDANVTTLSRRPTAAMLAFLGWTHRTCAVEGCGRNVAEIDHRIPWAQSGHTRVPELDPYCRYHHRKKHHDGWALINGTGPRLFVPPHDPRHPRRTARPPASGDPPGQAA